MDIDIRYDREGGIYFLNGIRVLILPEGSLELIQETIGKILGLATKNIFQDTMSTITYSFITDLINSKLIKRRAEEKMRDEIFDLFQNMGFGRTEELLSEPGVYSITVERGFNSRSPSIKSVNYCFQELGHLQGIYRAIFDRDASVEETKCKSTGSSEIDLFVVKVFGSKQKYTYMPSKSVYPQKNLEKIEVMKTLSSVLINSIPVEIIPANYFPYLFSRLRSIIGLGLYGVETNIGLALAKLYFPFSFDVVSMKYQINGFELVSPLTGAGKVNTIKTDMDYIKELDVRESFNALHIDSMSEKRCSMLSGLLSGLSYKLIGTSVKLKETDCSAINGSICKFSFE